MLPDISIEKLKREIRMFERLQQIKEAKERVEEELFEKIQMGERFIKKFPNGKTLQSCTNLELLEYGKEIRELRDNPFYKALEANREEKERMEKMKEM